MKTLRKTTSDGVTSLFDVDFELGYFSKTHIYVYAGTDNSLYETQLTYTWQTDTQLELTVPDEYPVGTVINIRRVVPRDELYVDFRNGTGITEDSLNNGNLQGLMILEEQDDGFKPEGYFEKQDLSFEGLYTIKDLRKAEANGEPLVYEQLFDAEESISASIIADGQEQVALATAQAELAQEYAEDAEDAVATLTPRVTATEADILELQYINNLYTVDVTGLASATIDCSDYDSFRVVNVGQAFTLNLSNIDVGKTLIVWVQTTGEFKTTVPGVYWPFGSAPYANTGWTQIVLSNNNDIFGTWSTGFALEV